MLASGLDQEGVDLLGEEVADEETEQDRSGAVHQPVAQLDQMIEQRHLAIVDVLDHVVLSGSDGLVRLSGARSATR